MGVGGTTGDPDGGWAGAIGWDHALKGSDADAHCCYGHRNTNFHFSTFKSIPSHPSVPSLSAF